jgi:serine phosphatase RsbU (regulator of sigma subunit)
MSAAGDEYGEERILAVVDKETSLAPADLLKSLFADVRAFTKGAPQSDDITALVLRYGPAD